jgi:hypothetical protein
MAPASTSSRSRAPEKASTRRGPLLAPLFPIRKPAYLGGKGQDGRRAELNTRTVSSGQQGTPEIKPNQPIAFST